MSVTAEREIDVALFRVGNKPTGSLAGKIAIPDNLQILEKPEEVPLDNFGVFRIMTPKDGDKRVVWDRRDFAQILEAKSMFDACVVQGLVPYRVGLNGKASADVMSEFDPHAEEIIFLPIAMVTGG